MIFGAEPGHLGTKLLFFLGHHTKEAGLGKKGGEPQVTMKPWRSNRPQRAWGGGTRREGGKVDGRV